MRPVYYYIYDEFTQDKKYQKELAAIERRLTDLELGGKISRLALFRSPEELIRDELKQGVTTVVVVGNDSTVFKVLDIVTEYGVTLGIIPVGEKNSIATALGIPEGELACDTLSARITETLDTGFVNGKRFLTRAVIENFAGDISCGTFAVFPSPEGKLEVRNLFVGAEGEPVMPKDGFLHLTLTTEGPSRSWSLFSRNKRHTSHIPLQTFTVTTPSVVNMQIDEDVLEDRRFTVGVDPNTLKVVTGRDRLFS